MTQAPRRLKALIIDDERAIRRFLRTTLAAEDFDVAEAETGAAGVELDAGFFLSDPDLCRHRSNPDRQEQCRAIHPATRHRDLQVEPVRARPAAH